ncbi:FAD binding domain-containing protein [Sneathiella chinensis]|uniref:Xanthine dehydrogenase n=1 Tax=Sneathiella chinensis TaxID=349750 RepID=A0ABQ5U391_9PROT|nr:xanthine dehydrogenase family protein subunit M [Sneathiella chinensis]GLQ06630.1 xanthine dehydrogenase [Sneathiella chinensis]
MGDYYRPAVLSDLLQRLEAGNAAILAGGTDFYPARVGRHPHENIIDITAVQALKGIRETADGWTIGAATTWADVTAAELPPLFDGLRAAAREVGGRQIQNAGTIGGNVCNASPAADGMPALLSLDAEVEIQVRRGCHRMPVRDFVLGNRKTQLEAGEIVTAFHFPRRDPQRSKGSFLKLGARRYLVISLVMVAGSVEWDSDRIITSCRIAVGACSEVAERLAALENRLIGQKLSGGLEALVGDDCLAGLAPIDDVRATAAYRQEAAGVLLRRLIREWGEMA